jgi:hypothetical protein
MPPAGENLQKRDRFQNQAEKAFQRHAERIAVNSMGKARRNIGNPSFE